MPNNLFVADLVRQKWVQGLEVLHLFRCLFKSLLLELFCTKVAAGILRPGILRAGILRPGILRPGILRPFHVHFDHPRAAFLVQRLKYV